MMRVALVLAASASVVVARTRVGGATDYVIYDSTMDNLGFDPLFLSATLQASSLRIVTETNIESSYDYWEIYTGPETYCSAEHFNGGAWPFTKVFDGAINSGSPHDTGVIPGAPAEKFCVVFKCDNSWTDCKGITIDIDLYASSSNTQSCSSSGVFPDPITSVAKESEVNPSWKCAWRADDGLPGDHDLFPLVTVAPVPGGPVETLRWCEGASICLPQGASASPSAGAQPSSTPTRPPTGGSSSCPAGMVPNTGSPTSICKSDWSDCFSNNWYTVNPPTAVVNRLISGAAGGCPGSQGSYCVASCTNCVIECVNAIPSATPTRSPSVTPSRTPSVSPSRSASATPSRSPTRSPSSSVVPAAVVQASSSPAALAADDDDATQSAGGAGGTVSGGGNAQGGVTSSGDRGSAGADTMTLVGAVVGVVAVVGLAAGGYWYYNKQQKSAAGEHNKDGAAADGQSQDETNFQTSNPGHRRAVNPAAVSPAPPVTSVGPLQGTAAV